MQVKTITALLMLVSLVVLVPTCAQPVFAIGPVMNFPWIGTHQITQGYHLGYGLDFGLNHDPLYASGSGTVYSTYTSAPDQPDQNQNQGWGNEVIIKHADGYYTRYAHLSAVWVSVRQTVARGDPIGISGNSGHSTAPHLHFEVYRYGLANGDSVEPGPISGYNNPITDPVPPGAYTNNSFAPPDIGSKIWIEVELRDLLNQQPVNINPLHQQKTLTVQVSNGSNQVVAQQQIKVNFVSRGTIDSGSYGGLVDFGNALSGGPYIIRVRLGNTLVRLIPGIYHLAQGTTTTARKVGLVLGDINGDNRLDILDYNILIGCYSDFSAPKNCPDPNLKAASDLTDDGAVNLYDANLFVRILSVQPGQ